MEKHNNKYVIPPLFTLFSFFFTTNCHYSEIKSLTFPYFLLISVVIPRKINISSNITFLQLKHNIKNSSQATNVITGIKKRSKLGNNDLLQNILEMSNIYGTKTIVSMIQVFYAETCLV